MKTKLMPLVLTALVSALLATGCDVISYATERVEGSGNVVTETRQLPPFTGVSVRGSTDVEITVGPAQSVTIEADDNIMPRIETRVSSGTLIIDSKGWFTSTRNVRVTLTMPSLDEVSLAGSGDVQAKGIDAATFEASIAGSGDITAAGSAEGLSASVAGSGDMHLYDLLCKHADVSVAGSGDVQVHVSESLSASIAGSGDVSYKGRPPEVKRSIVGSGEIKATD